MNTIEQLKKKFQSLEKLDTNISNIIYEKIKESEIPHSENKNGIFINLSSISQNHIELLNSYLDKEYIIDDVKLEQIDTLKKRDTIVFQNEVSENIKCKPFIVTDLEKTIIDYSLS